MAETQTPSVLQSVINVVIGAASTSATLTLPVIATEAVWNVWFSPITTTAPASGTVITLEGNSWPSGSDNLWEQILPITTGTTAAATSTANGMTSSGQLTATNASSATFGARSTRLFISDSATSGEFIMMLKHVTNTITFQDVTQATHANGVSIYNQGQMFSIPVTVSGYARLRMRTDNNVQATGPTIAIYSEIGSYKAQ